MKIHEISPLKDSWDNNENEGEQSFEFVCLTFTKKEIEYTLYLSDIKIKIDHLNNKDIWNYELDLYDDNGDDIDFLKFNFSYKDIEAFIYHLEDHKEGDEINIKHS